MIKNDPLRYFSHGYEIKEQLKTIQTILKREEIILLNIYILE